MRIKNFHENLEQIPNTERSKVIDRAILQTFLLTDGSVIPTRYQISFASTSRILIKQFCDLVFSVYGYKIKKVSKGKSTKQPLHLIQFKSKLICLDLLSDIPSYRTAPFKDGSYPETKIPENWFRFSNNEIATVLRTIFDTEGGCSLRISWRRKRKCFEIERQVFLSCQHPILRKQYKQLLDKLGIKCSESSDKVVITGKGNYEKFRDLINFSEGVIVGYDSKHWCGIEKRELLYILIKSYDIPHGSLQKFKKNQAYSLLWPPLR
jgi:hypothetical protein